MEVHALVSLNGLLGNVYELKLPVSSNKKLVIAPITGRRSCIEVVGHFSLLGDFWTEEEVTVIAREIVGGFAI